MYSERPTVIEVMRQAQRSEEGLKQAFSYYVDTVLQEFDESRNYVDDVVSEIVCYQGLISPSQLHRHFNAT